MRELLRALGITGWNLGRSMNTEPLPWKGDRPRAARFRTSFALVHDEHGEEACIGCKMCEKICPSDIIVVEPGGRSPSPVTGKARGYCKDFTLDLGACIHCELCVQVCPTDAIVMLQVQETPTFSREDLLLTMEKLYANEPKAHAKETGTTLIAMQEPPKPPPKAEAPKPAPAVAADPPPAHAEPAATSAPAAPAAPADPTAPASPSAAPPAKTEPS